MGVVHLPELSSESCSVFECRVECGDGCSASYWIEFNILFCIWVQCGSAATGTVRLPELSSASCSVFECSVEVLLPVQCIFLNWVQYLILYSSAVGSAATGPVHLPELSSASCSVFECSVKCCDRYSASSWIEFSILLCIRVQCWVLRQVQCIFLNWVQHFVLYLSAVWSAVTGTVHLPELSSVSCSVFECSISSWI